MPDPNWIVEPMLIYRVLFSLVGALVVSFAFTPLVRILAQKVGAIDDPKRDDRRMHKEPMPRMGGLAIFAGFIVSFLVFGLEWMDRTVTGIIIGAVVIIVVGAIDDIISLPWWGKLIGQFAAALTPVLFGLRADVFTNPIGGILNLGIFNIPVTVLWIVAIINAVNLIDGLDGLATGVSMIASMSMLLIALATGNPAAALITATLAGGCLGFLPYNINPARLIMGDCGALFLGYVLSCASILGLFKLYAVISFVIPFIILGLPIFDTLAAFVRRVAKGQNPFSTPDRGHMHHRLIDLGFTQKQAVAILYCISAVLGLTAVVWTTAGEIRILLLAIAVLAAVLVWIGIIRKRHSKTEAAAALPADTSDADN